MALRIRKRTRIGRQYVIEKTASMKPKSEESDEAQNTQSVDVHGDF